MSINCCQNSTHPVHLMQSGLNSLSSPRCLSNAITSMAMDSRDILAFTGYGQGSLVVALHTLQSSQLPPIIPIGRGRPELSAKSSSARIEGRGASGP